MYIYMYIYIYVCIRNQAEDLASPLAAFGPDLVLVSPLRRALHIYAYLCIIIH